GIFPELRRSLTNFSLVRDRSSGSGRSVFYATAGRALASQSRWLPARIPTKRDVHDVNSDLKGCDLSGTLSRMGGGHPLVQQIVQFFQEDAPQYLSRLHSAVEGADPDRVLHAAHSLHGLVVTFGAEAASLAALRLEDIGRSGDLTSVDEAVAALEDEISRLQTALTHESESH